ncbi:MAG: hypothetical protein IPI93_00035 [Sphingobacteriaceae bacterium]|nr:hypothetical protein [Sphingobacteriaceae bacterium]
MKNNSYIKKIIDLNDQYQDRYCFHEEAGKLLSVMAKDKEFWNEVVKQNFTDKGYLNRKWTMYDIPFLYVYECDDFYVKVHLFVPLSTYEPHVVASAIHHHNNYMLTSYAAYGSGYETMLFEKDYQIDPVSKITNLRMREHFTQQERPLHLIDAWEPHVVINPTSFSATLIVWSPDKKRVTDSLRSNPILKALKMPIRKIIYAFGMEKKLGIAAKDTYQFYVKENKFHAVLEDDFFAPTRERSGRDVDDYSIQAVFAFIQRIGFNDKDFLKRMKESNSVPHYYHRWINMLLIDEVIPDVYAKETINIPGGRMVVNDIFGALNKK